MRFPPVPCDPIPFFNEAPAMTDRPSRQDISNGRRDMLKGAAAGLGLAAAPALAQPSASQSAGGQPTGGQPGGSQSAGGQPAVATGDPRSRFTSTPFPEQRQKWPALQREMTPVPDCGERSYRGSGRLRGLRILVTGGDSGIGRAAAIAFAREGAAVTLNYFPTEEPDAQDVARLLRGEGASITLLPGDLTDQAFCTRLVAAAAKAMGGLDVLVNNAAYQQSKALIDEITPEQFDRTMKTNVYALFWLSKAAIPLLRPGATIINTLSVNSFDPGKELLDYATTKGAQLIFTKGLAKQLADRGIRVNGVAPGPFWTPLQVAGGQLPGKLGEFGKNTPLGRAGQPAEIASLFVTLADPALSFTSGSVLGATGGTGVV